MQALREAGERARRLRAARALRLQELPAVRLVPDRVARDRRVALARRHRRTCRSRPASSARAAGLAPPFAHLGASTIVNSSDAFERLRERDDLVGVRPHVRRIGRVARVARAACGAMSLHTMLYRMSGGASACTVGHGERLGGRQQRVVLQAEDHPALRAVQRVSRYSTPTATATTTTISEQHEQTGADPMRGVLQHARATIRARPIRERVTRVPFRRELPETPTAAARCARRGRGGRRRLRTAAPVDARRARRADPGFKAYAPPALPDSTLAGSKLTPRRAARQADLPELLAELLRAVPGRGAPAGLVHAAACTGGRTSSASTCRTAAMRRSPSCTGTAGATRSCRSPTSSSSSASASSASRRRSCSTGAARSSTRSSARRPRASSRSSSRRSTRLAR